MMFFSQYWWFALPGLLLGIYAQIKLSSAYGRYLEVGTQAGLSGAEAARAILDNAGLGRIPVEEIGGRLTDHFDPSKKALFLSSDNFHGRSVSAVGVAAHEAGHALQQQAAYALFDLRMWLVPATQIASFAGAGFSCLLRLPRLRSAVHRAGHRRFQRAHLVSGGDLARGIRCEPAGQGAASEAGPRPAG